MSNVVLQSTKHNEITFPHEYIFIFILYFIGAITSKNVKNEEVWINIKRGLGHTEGVKGGIQTKLQTMAMCL